jgi:hypothetical protein
VDERLSERIEQARAVCRGALGQSPLGDAALFLERRKITEQVGLELLRAGARVQKATPELWALTEAAQRESGTVSRTGVVERALLVRGALGALDQIGGLAVEESVKHLFCREFISYAEGAAAPDWYASSGFPFFAMSKIVLLERFPGGQLQWEISGFPRRWLARIPGRALPRALSFLALQARGLHPYFVWHVGGTTKRLPFLLEREALKTFYRMAATLEMQPGARAILGGSWLHSVETHRVSPHLAFLNRPFLEAGGIYLDLGPAQPDDGFLAGDPRRAELYASGEYRPTFGLVICSREQAIGWKRGHPELEKAVRV